MTLQDKLVSIKYLKGIVVKHQKYEFASWLRDRERKVIEDIDSLSSAENAMLVYDGPISYVQYLYLTELISDFEKSSSNFSKSIESEMRDYLYKNCLPAIRAEKLDKLLGDES
jgi:hypothetical protein